MQLLPSSRAQVASFIAADGKNDVELPILLRFDTMSGAYEGAHREEIETVVIRHDCEVASL